MYKIQLPNFEGPYDLMLYFIRRDELNIYDIPIAKITNEFLNYIRIMKYFDLELAGEFILTSASLMRIKSKTLLPANENDNSEENEDPRTELVRKLLEYKQIKEVTSDLNKLSENTRYHYYRQIFEAQNKEILDNLPYKNATLFDLINALNKLLEKNKIVQIEHIVEQVSMSVEDRIVQLKNILANKHRISFFELLANETKELIVLTFLSLLDLARSNNIFISQDDNFEDIIISNKISNDVIPNDVIPNDVIPNDIILQN
ncbi:MAG: segregation and condensation protein A [Candidatus Kapaibacteriota bacterium]